jgi:hypothetical protein
VKNATLPKFRPGGLLVVHCGGGAGLFSAMIGGWASGAVGSEPVMREIGRKPHARSEPQASEGPRS